MKTRRWILLLVLAPLGAALFVALRPPAHDPVYEGRRLSAWLKGEAMLSSSNFLARGFYQISSGAYALHGSMQGPAWGAAVESLGTNSIPGLLRELGCHDSSVRRSIAQWLGRTRILRITYRPATPRRLVAVEGFRILGQRGVPALPALVELLDDNDPGVRASALTALGALDNQARPVVARLFACLNDRDYSVRDAAGWTLRKIRHDPAMLFPARTGRIAVPPDEFEGPALGALERLRAAASPAVPALLQALRHRDSSIRHAASNALYEMNMPAFSSVAGN